MRLIRDIHFMDSDEGDWVGVYIDDELVYEAHHLAPDVLLDLLEIPYTCEERDLSIVGRCPKTLGESE